MEVRIDAELAGLLAPFVKDGETIRRLAQYAGLLERWSERHNLVRFGSRRELVERHIGEALAGVSRLPERGRLLDVGSGAGLPGVPLLVARPEWTGLLLEPRQKRWAFLRTVIRELRLDAVAEARRYQEYRGRGTFDAVTVRALGGLPDLLVWVRERLSPGGRVLVWGTDEAEAQVGSLPSWRVLSSPLAGLERGRLIELRPCST